MLSKLYYISQGKTPTEHLNHIKTVLDAGVTLVQLRLKNTPEALIYQTALEAQQLCKTYNAQFVLNDYWKVAQQLGCNVHLGLGDENIATVKAQLSKDCIIGGTTNTVQDVDHQINSGCNYIGIGPLRFTTTKQNLSPLLGLEGITAAANWLKNHAPHIPAYAIGGITLQDIEALAKTGIYGIAVSGLLTKSSSVQNTVNDIHQFFK